MNAQNLPSHLRRQAKELERYVMTEFPGMAGRKILRFIDGNFRAQGWQGASFQRWKPNRRGGTILVRRGILRRSFRQEVGAGSVRTYSTSPYAAIHNRGFRGTVSIKAHSRRKYEAQRIGTGRFTKTGRERKKTIHVQSGVIQVKAHTRKVNIPQRQMMPERYNDSPVLINSIKRDVIKTLKNIFNS